MVKQWEVRWEGELAARPQDVWDAITQHADGYLWKIDYEPWVGGAERGLTAGGGTVTVWEPLRHFATRARPETERDGFNEIDYVLEPLGAATYLRYTHRAEIAGGRLRPSARRPAGSTRASTTTRSASTRATSPAASRSTSASTGRRPPPTAASSPLRRALGLAGRRRGRRPRAPDAGGARPDRRRRRLRHRPVPRRPQRRRAATASTGATLGAGPSASPTTCSPTAPTRRRASGRGATGSTACSTTEAVA